MSPVYREIYELIERIRPILAGHPPEVQGAVLADLNALWLCGHPPEVRTDLLAFQIEHIGALCRENDRLRAQAKMAN